MNKVILTSKWIGTGQPGNPFRPKLVAEYPQMDYSDRTGMTRRTSNLNTASELEVTCSDAELATLQADPDYTIISVEPISQE